MVTAIAEMIHDLINSLEIKTNQAIQWMENNMIVNPEKFKADVLTKHNDQTVSSDHYIFIISQL